MRAVTLISGGLKNDPLLPNQRAFRCPALRVARFLATRLIHTLPGDAHLKSQISTQPSLSAVYNAAPRRNGPHTRTLRRTTARLFQTAFLRPVNGHSSSITVEHCVRSRRTTGVQSSCLFRIPEKVRRSGRALQIVADTGLDTERTEGLQEGTSTRMSIYH